MLEMMRVQPQVVQRADESHSAHPVCVLGMRGAVWGWGRTRL